MNAEEIILQLQQQFSISNVEKVRPGLTFMTVEPVRLVPVVTNLKVNHGFKVLVIISAVDWLEEAKFQLTYIVNNPELKCDIGIRIFIDRENPVAESIHDLWKHAPTFQREIKEMFGIDFPGSPGVDDPFMLEGWDDVPPMRRDFDTKKYAEETYFPRPGRTSNDPATYMKQMLYPDKEDAGK